MPVNSLAGGSLCRNLPNDWTEEEIHHYAWTQIVNMNIKKAEKEVLTERTRYAG
jgi:hypothetical protein